MRLLDKGIIVDISPELITAILGGAAGVMYAAANLVNALRRPGGLRDKEGRLGRAINKISLVRPGALRGNNGIDKAKKK